MQQWIIGRGDNCDIVVDSDVVSSEHCRLTRDGDKFSLEDLNSTNGTFVNGNRISQRVVVSRSDSITLGRNLPLTWPDKISPAATVALPVNDIVLTIGRATNNGCVLDAPGVSWHHARLCVEEGKRVLEDLGSTNGTFLNSRANEIGRASLSSEDVVYFGSYRIAASRLIEAAENPVRPVALVIHVGDKPLVLGRDPDCDHILDHPMISWHHARLSRWHDSFLVEDLNSSNGTFINGERVSGKSTVCPGDQIVLGSFALSIEESGTIRAKDHRSEMTIEADKISVAVPGKRLLEQVSLVIFPSELVGLMGPSGAGKSTLMNALNGYVAPAEGVVRLAGLELNKHYALFRGQIGYVPQDDIMHCDLTVWQALYYTARLRFPADTSDSEIDKRIDEVLGQLSLQETEDIFIGSPEKKGISGGQRKRVNLAMELLTDPPVLFLDEPTSGLSSEDALNVMRVLRQLANTGKVILLTIHQPSLEAYRLMDNLVVVAKDTGSSDPGMLAYYGPAYPEAIRFFNPGSYQANDSTEPSPDEVLRGLSKRPTIEWVRRYEESDQRHEFIEKRQETKAAKPSILKQELRVGLGLRQSWTLMRRTLAVKLHDRANSLLLMVQAPIVAVLIVMVFGEDAGKKMTDENWHAVASATSTTVFLLALSAIWFGCSNSAREIVAEWAIYRRERMVNLKVPAYIASKLSVLVGLCALQSAILLTIVHAGSGLDGGWIKMYVILVLASAVGVGIGLVVSALARTSEFAVAMLPVIILPMVILGGVLQPVHEMNVLARVPSNVMPSRWAFEALLLVESGERRRWIPPMRPAVATFPETEQVSEVPEEKDPEDLAENGRTESFDVAEAFFPAENQRFAVSDCFVVLSVMMFVAVCVLGGVLVSRDIH